MNPKKILLPYIADLNTDNIDVINDILEEQGIGDTINEVNWKTLFPYRPITLFRIARTESSIFIKFQVRGNILKAVYTEDNDPVYKDSCVEFFCKLPDKEYYTNFEFNCIGTCSASKRKARKENVVPFSKQELKSIKRYTTLANKPFNELEGSFEWELTVEIPFDLIGIEQGNLPTVLYANFYKCADDTISPHYVSWNPVETEKPDFHRPEYFGELAF